ncbi:MAG: hypothetical protein KF747_16720 [Nitrospira sp.]|nr:hypothetical protein [Nitrospira sp.]
MTKEINGAPIGMLEECLAHNESGSHELEKGATYCILCTIDESANLCIGDGTSLVRC